MLVIACVACFSSCEMEPSLPADISMAAKPSEVIVHYTDAIISGVISFSGNTEEYISSLKGSLSVTVELEKKNSDERNTYPASLEDATKENFKVIIPFVANPNNLEDGATYYYRISYQFGKDEAQTTDPVKFFTLPQGPVDLDLPSGLLWASHNLGADYPEESGNYYAWGETESKKENGRYSWSGYKWCDGASDKLTKYCINNYYGKDGFVDDKTVLEPEDDAVVKNLGENWRTPHPIEFTELLEKCQHADATINGVSGELYRSKKNPDDDKKVIFIPKSGYMDDVNLHDYSFFYMTSTSKDNYAYIFEGSSLGTRLGARCYGFPIRPVLAK